MNQQEEKKERPVSAIRRGRVTAAIWKNVSQKGETYYSFTLEKSFKDAEGNLQATKSFTLSDALYVAKVADLADNRIRQIVATESASEKAQEEFEEVVE